MVKLLLRRFLLGGICGALIVIGVSPYLLPQHEQQHSIFIYGTLENNFIRYYACLCLVPESPATLKNYKQMGLNIIPNNGETVSGSIISVSANQLDQIDDYENVPHNYTRETVIIDGETHWVYIKNQ